MARMDERAKSELYKISQEKLFVSVIIIAFFLIIKISLQSGIITMIGELTATGVIFLYLIPYFIIRYRYRTIDEMVKKKIYKLSTTFFVIELASLLPVIAINTLMMINRIGAAPIKLMDTSFPFMMTLVMITNFYGLIRMHSEKFVSQNAASTDLAIYKKKILIRAAIATIILIILLIIFIVINFAVIDKLAADSEISSTWAIWYSMVALTCILGIPAIWLLYFYYLGARKKLEKKMEAELTATQSTDEI